MISVLLILVATLSVVETAPNGGTPKNFGPCKGIQFENTAIAGTFTTVSATDLNDCVMKCLNRDDCKSVTFGYNDKRVRVCYIHPSKLADYPDSLKTVGRYTGYTHVDIISCPEPEYTGEKGECGKPSFKYLPDLPRQKRMIGGTPAKEHSWPWEAYLDAGGYACGSSLVRVNEDVEESDILVTAAHCVFKSSYKNRYGKDVPLDKWQILPPENMRVTLGAHNLNVFEIGKQIRKVKEIIPPVDEPGINNDMALLLLDKPVKFSETIRPVCLPKQDAPPPVKETCVAVGWGRISNTDLYTTSPVLKELPLTVYDDASCKEKSSGHLNTTMMCALATDISTGTCEGDSGGPLACDEGGSWTLYGAVSHGATSYVRGEPPPPAHTCTSKATVSEFTRISHYVDWIKEQIKKKSEVNAKTDDDAGDETDDETRK